MQLHVQSGAVITGRCPIYHDIIHGTAMTGAELTPDFKLTTDTPHPAPTGEVWAINGEDFV